MISNTKTRVFAALAALTAWSGPAAAQTMAPYHLRGSDTWYDVINDALTAAKAAGFALNDLFYDGTGSGNAETQMVNNLQSIGPMSRNFKASVLDPALMNSHPSWAPTVQNAAGLDAPVLVVRSYNKVVKDITLPTGGNDPSGVGNPKYAAKNNSALVGTFGVKGSGYDQLLGIVLSGVDGSGTVPACADPRRVQAVADLAFKQGVVSISHLYRRDDNSGTTTTIQEKLQVPRFCNGFARGVLGMNQVNANLNNQDFDPIRRPCPAPVGTDNATTCTNMKTGASCVAGDADCTQGLIVAISIGEPGFPDATDVISHRVAQDATNATMGYAGREAARKGNGAVGPTINTIAFSDVNIRNNSYMLARVLYIQHAADNTDLGVPAVNIPGGGGMNQFNQETTFWNWLTDPTGGNNSDGAPGRCHLDPILKTRGFLGCTSNCANTPTGGNLCAITPYFTASSFPANCGPVSNNGGPSWGYEQVASTAAVCCSSNAAPTMVMGVSTCPAVSGLPTNAACSDGPDCLTGVCLTDPVGIGINLCQ